MKHSFGSDNHSGVHPNIMEAIARANSGYAEAYCEDDYSLKVLSRIESLFGGECKAFFVLNGIGANILSLATVAHSTDAILCPASAHINVDECGAPEKLTSAKLIPLEHTNGKVTPETVENHLVGFGFQHHSQPKVLSISQATELGTNYSLEEIKALADLMHSYGCLLHIDGSRLANATAALGISLKEYKETGVDVISLGGTKNGMLIGEAVIFFNRVNSDKTIYLRKQLSQLYSKSRFIAAQFDAYLKDDLFLSLASNANNMAKYLAERLSSIPQITITRPVETNAVFAIVPKELYESLRKNHCFYLWNEKTMEVRWMCSFSSRQEDIDSFIEEIILLTK